MFLIQRSDSSHLTCCCLVLLSYWYCCCSRDECLSQCQNVTPLSVLEGGSRLFPLNTSAKSHILCKCKTSTSSCIEVALVQNGKSKTHNSSDPHRVSMTGRYLNVTNARKDDAADYKIEDMMSVSGECMALIRLTVQDPAPLAPCTSQPPLARVRSPNGVAEEEPEPPQGSNWIMWLLVGLLVLGTVAFLLFIGYKKGWRVPSVISCLPQRIPCLSANSAACQPDGSPAVSQELMEVETHHRDGEIETLQRDQQWDQLASMPENHLSV